MTWHAVWRWSVLGVLTSPAALRAQTFDSTFTRQVAPGVTHRRLVVNSVPWNINVVTVRLDTPGLAVQAAHAKDTFLGRETVAEIAARHQRDGEQVLAAINADFFQLSDGAPINNFVVEGNWWRGLRAWPTAAPSHSQFALTQAGRPLIERFSWVGTVSSRRYPEFALDGLNAAPGADGVTLFTQRYGASTPRDSAGRVLFDVPLTPVGHPGDTVLFQVADTVRSGGGSSLAGRAVLVGGATARNRLVALGPPGTPVRFLASVLPDRGKLATLVGGLPRLVVHGKGIADTALADAEGTNANLRLRHPRSAIGFTRDSTTLLLVTVDGRQPGSAGMDLMELSQLMLTLGAFEAVNLDGGGSTTLVVAGEVVNRPSDAGGPRTVGNALLVVQGPPPPPSRRPRPH
ncbi:MAG: phosphodiester glycosidase family protein [Gemmatimonadota bacterium]